MGSTDQEPVVEKERNSGTTGAFRRDKHGPEAGGSERSWDRKGCRKVATAALNQVVPVENTALSPPQPG